MPTDFMQGWSNFFVAELGAAAALSGLIFVAVSISLARILQFPSYLPARAAEALLSLLSVLVVTTCALIPRQSAMAFGVETAATGLLVWAMHTRILIRTRKFDRQYVGLVVRLIETQLPPLSFVIAGGLLIAGRPAGVYWIVPGILLSFTVGIVGAWVLLVEIHR